MEIKINREIREYTESMFFGLSLRQFIFSLLAILSAVGIYFVFKPYLGTEITSWLCVLGAAPFAAMGFVRYNGMTAERFLLSWLRSEFINPQKLIFQKATRIWNEIKYEKEPKKYENFIKSNKSRPAKIINPAMRAGFYPYQNHLGRRNIHGRE